MTIIRSNIIELHYYFGDESHAMDAFVQNKCEYEFLSIFKEIASNYDFDIVIETEPFAEGGLRRWFKVVVNEENRKALITSAVVVSLMSTIVVTPITTSISKTVEILIEKIFEDKEIKELEKEKLILEVENLKLEIQEKSKKLNDNNIIKKKRSNFYENLEKYPKINKVSFTVEDKNKSIVSDEKSILRSNFKNFILVNGDIEPIEIEDAVIEIISPVLKKGKYKWLGLYNGNPIVFTMKSNEFKTLIQTGIIKFKNGASINCYLIINRKIDNEGSEKIVNHEVLRVNNYFENDKPIETPEGKRHRQKKEDDMNQLNLFSDNF